MLPSGPNTPARALPVPTSTAITVAPIMVAVPGIATRSFERRRSACRSSLLGCTVVRNITLAHLTAPAPCTFLKKGVRPATSSGGNRGRGRWSAGEHARSPALARTSTHPGAPNRPTNCSGGSHVRRHTCQPPAASRPWYLRVKRRMMREAEVPPGDYGREDGGHDRILDRSKCGPSGELPIRKVTTPAPVDGGVAGRTPDERRQLVPWAQEAERDRRATGPGRAPGARCRG